MPLLLTFLFAGMAFGAPHRDNDVWSVAKLDLDLRIDPAAGKLHSSGEMALRLEGEASDTFALTMNSRVRSMRFESVHVSRGSATVRSPSVDPTESVNVRLNKRRGRADEVRLRFVASSGIQSSQFVINDKGALGSWVEAWYPMPPGRRDAIGATIFRVPSSWRCVSNGRLESSAVVGGERVERWVTDIPVARSFACGPYQTIETADVAGGKVMFYLFEPRPDIRLQATNLAHAITALTERFGPYPYSSYSVAEVPEETSFAAGSEQGFIMVRTSILDNGTGNLPLFAHEASHAWWGNLVGSSGPGGSMLTEALAQYGAVLAIEALEGRVAMTDFLRFSREGYNPLQCALGYFHIWRVGGDRPLALLEQDKWDHNLADSKGMWFYRMLRSESGDELFFSILRSILEDFRGGIATHAELRKRFVAAKPDLETFFTDWLDGSGAPVLRLDWWSIERGTACEITIEQLQPGQLFRSAVEIAIERRMAPPLRHTVMLTSRRTTVRIPTESRPLNVVMDPDHDLLMWRPEFGPPIVAESAAAAP